MFADVSSFRQRLLDGFSDYFFNRAGTETGFLKLIGWFRFLMLLSLVVRFGFDQAVLIDTPFKQNLFRIVAWAYFIFIIFLRYLASFHPDIFNSRRSKLFQAIIDLLVVAFFYGLVGNPRSDVFLFFLLPLLIIARYFDIKMIIRFLIFTVAITLVVWVLTIDPDSLTSGRFWILVLLSRLSFLVVVLMFYLIYYRRRRLLRHLDETESSLVGTFDHLKLGSFTVDRDLRVTSMNNLMRNRHGIGLRGSSCSTAFCRVGKRLGKSCPDCPLELAVREGETVPAVGIQYSDHLEHLYTASVSALPLFDKENRVVGAAATVENLSLRQQYRQMLRSYTDNVERTIDQLIQEDRTRAEKMTRQMTAITKSATATLSPEQPVQLDEMVRAAANLFHCQAADIRRYRCDENTGQEGLILEHSFGFSPDDRKKRYWLGLNKSSLVVDAYFSGEPKHATDIQAQSGLIQFTDLARKYGLYSLACFPLIVGDEKIGTLSLYRKRRLPFTAEELDLGKTLASNLAMTIYNRRLQENLKLESMKQQQRLDALRRLSLELAPHDNPEELARLVTDITRLELHAELASIFHLEGKTLYRIAISGVEADWFPDERYQVGEGITGQVLIRVGDGYQGQVQKDNFVSNSNVVVPEHRRRYAQILKTGSAEHLVGIPLNGQKGTFGVLRVVNKLDEEGNLHTAGFNQQDIDLLSTIACMAAVAIENSQRLAEQNLLMSMAQTVTSSLSSDEILNKSLQQAVKMLGAETGSILLRDEKTGSLNFKVIVGDDPKRLQQLTLPNGKGIANSVLETGKPELVSDVTEDERWYSHIDAKTDYRTESILAVPIKTRNKNIGVIEVLNKREGVFLPPDLRLLSAVSSWIAIATENARLFESEKNRRFEKEALLNNMQTLASSLELKHILPTIVHRLRELVKYDSTSLFLREGDRLLLIGQSGFSSEEKDSLVQPSLDAVKNPAFQIMNETHLPLVINDNHKEKLLEHIAGTAKIRSWIGAPLIFQGVVIGHLAVVSWKPNQYDEIDAALVQAFAQQAAVAISNARLFKSEQERAKRLLDLNESLISFTKVSTQKEVVDQIAQSVVELYESDIVGVALYDKEKKEIYALPDAGHQGVSQAYARNFRFHIDRPGGEVLRKPGVFTTYDADVDSESIFGERLVKMSGARAIMAAPLMVGSRLVGILYTAMRRPYAFSKEEQNIFMNLASHAAIAIRNAELLYKEERRAELALLFHQISIAGQRTSDLDCIFNIVLTGVTAHYGLRFNRALLLLLDNDRKNLVGYTGIGQTVRQEAGEIWQNLEERTFEEYVQEVLEHGVPEWTSAHSLAKNLQIPVNSDNLEVFSQVFVTGESAIINPKDGATLINNDYYRLFEPDIFALVPLTINNRVIGILVVDNKFTGAPISDTDLELLTACTSQAAAAYERSQLYRQSQHRIETLSHLQEMSQYISQLSELHRVLERIAKAANALLKADISHIVPYDSPSNQLLVDLAVTDGDSGDFEHTPHFSESGLTNLVLEEPSGFVMREDLTAHKGLVSRFAAHEGICSTAVIRLDFRGEVVGILYVNFLHNRLLDEAEQNTLRLLADQAAIAIRNAHLLEQNEQLITRRERNRLQSDLHAVLNMLHIYVMIPTESIRNQLTLEGHLEQAAAVDSLWYASHHTYKNLKRIYADMRDPILVEQGLPVALQTFLDNIPEPRPQLTITGDTRPTAEVELSLFRIAQEGISNIVKHAGLKGEPTKPAAIDLDLHPSHVSLVIEDWGKGFDMNSLESAGRGLGLADMKHWANQIDTQCSINSSPAEGTRIEIHALMEGLA